MYHYVERIHHHIDVHKERLFDLHVVESLAKVFPKVIQSLLMSDEHTTGTLIRLYKS